MKEPPSWVPERDWPKFLREVEQESEGRAEAEEAGLSIARRLIGIYNHIYGPQALREEAARLVVALAGRAPAVVQLVIEDARAYAKHQHIDDASPYSPNSFEVLGRIEPANEYIVPFLEEVVKEDWGIARWSAIEALCASSHPSAEAVLRNLARGQYPPKKLDTAHDLQLIAGHKGPSFLAADGP